MADAHPDGLHRPPNKRQRTSAMYQRKRAVTACEPCRRRKTRCDNERPVCGFCQANNGRCSYRDASNDYATYDPASLAILDRINHVVSLLEARPLPDSNSSARAENSLGQISASQISPLEAAGRQLDYVDAHSVTLEGPSATTDDDLFGSTNAASHPAKLVNLESVLKWPVFSPSADPIAPINSLVLTAEAQSPLTSSIPNIGQNRGIQEHEFIPLSKRFLTLIHTKNPILDVVEYKKFVKEAAEQGPRWDGASCLVLITCALGCLSEPFDIEHERDFVAPHHAANRTVPANTDIDTAQAYYLAARKRIGLLQLSHLYIQCLFLCGVFEMYCLNPMQAWNYFNQACTQCRNLLWQQSQAQISTSLDPAIIQPIRSTTRLLEQRLYWSCVKSELELRCEIPLPPSGLADLAYPELFPSPPTGLSTPLDEDDTVNTENAFNDTRLHEQRSWLYYLAEISQRRMMNRAITILSPDDDDQKNNWVHNVWNNYQYVKDLGHQLDVWCAHIPPLINHEVSDHELAHFIHNRSVMFREWINRPFLYYAIHQPSDDPHMEQALPLAEECLQHCVTLIFRSPTHRQHGTWYVCRSSILRALLIVAGFRNGRLTMPDRWRESLDIARHIVSKYRDEAPDLEQGLLIFDSLLSDTCIPLS